jgi:hypothetical protein
VKTLLDASKCQVCRAQACLPPSRSAEPTADGSFSLWPTTSYIWRRCGAELATAHVEVLAYCLTSNHAHLVVVPRAADALGALFRRVHGRYAQYGDLPAKKRPRKTRP